ncbi:hypothetical protein A2U01_0069832, partial [Trifolium medium]|nr:hypothetical protein [Trifolium medium]
MSRKKPAFHDVAALRFGNINSALWTLPPPHIFRNVRQHNIFRLIISVQFLELAAFDSFMPSNLTLCTNHPITIWT